MRGKGTHQEEAGRETFQGKWHTTGSARGRLAGAGQRREGGGRGARKAPAGSALWAPRAGLLSLGTGCLSLPALSPHFLCVRVGGFCSRSGVHRAQYGPLPWQGLRLGGGANQMLCLGMQIALGCVESTGVECDGVHG